MLPFKLKPSYKDYIWGGTRLKTEFGKKTGLATLAESWELSAHADGPSIITTGELAGTPFSDFFSMYPALCGSKNRARADFPILIKLIDAAEALSIQVHPADDYARAHENDNGKTEMWYVLDHAPGAFLYFGFAGDITREEFARRIADGTLTEVLRAVPVQKGDVFFIPAGTIHAIGAGIVLAEVQQNSNATYRVFDYGRTGADGKPRALHIEKALDVTSLHPADTHAPGAAAPLEMEGCTLHRLASCGSFTVDALALTGEYKGAQDGSTFTSVLCTDGSGILAAEGGTLEARKGDSLFIPADVAAYRLSGFGSFLLTTT